MTEPSTFDEELSGLLSEIEEILPDGDGHKILDLLERLMNYKGLDEVEQKIVQNWKDALMFRGLLPPDNYNYLTDVICESPLDRGGFGEVYEGKWKEEQVAVKKFCHVRPPERIQGPYKEKFIQSVEPFKSFFREMVRWKMVSNFEYVWPLLGFTMLPDRDGETFVFALVSPLAEDNLKLSYKDWRSLSPKKFANYFHDVASGLQSLHDHGVIHGDIRPENILLYKSHCYLTDFGISTSIYASSYFSFASALIDQPPEVIDGSVTCFTKNTDIFSLGFTMYQVLAWHTSDITTEHTPRPEERLGQEWNAIWDLVLCCMSKEHTNRPTALQVVQRLKAF